MCLLIAQSLEKAIACGTQPMLPTTGSTITGSNVVVLLETFSTVGRCHEWHCNAVSEQVRGNAGCQASQRCDARACLNKQAVRVTRE